MAKPTKSTKPKKTKTETDPFESEAPTPEPAPAVNGDPAGNPFDQTGERARDDKMIPVIEVFGPTVQGEGLVIGYPTFFVRLGGCDYRCKMCDSMHAVLPELVNANATFVTPIALAEGLLEDMGYHTWLTISGGNPVLWDLTELVLIMRANGKKIAVETQGTMWRDWVPLCNNITVSPKGPGMGEKFNVDLFENYVERLYPLDHPELRHPGFSVKVVVFEQRDIELIADLLGRWPHLRPVMFASTGNFNPPKPSIDLDGEQMEEIADQERDKIASQCLQNYEKVIGMITSDPRLDQVRVLPQLHVLLWGNQACR